MLYASPNALSCFHRFGVMGSLVGRSLIEVTADLVEHQSPVAESMPLVVMGRAPWRTDLEARGVCLSVRAVPAVSGLAGPDADRRRSERCARRGTPLPAHTACR